MRKRTSKRRWKARARLGKKIPISAIIEHDLPMKLVFENRDIHRELAWQPVDAPGFVLRALTTGGLS